MKAFQRDITSARIQQKAAIVDWCARRFKECMELQKIEEALTWNYIAAKVLYTCASPLASPTLEQNLLEIAKLIPSVEWTRRSDLSVRRRWLHVIDRALPYGGHTAMAVRWISTDTGNVHSVALATQQTPVPETLVNAVRASGGEVLMGNQSASLLERACWIRKVAFSVADVVVLHVDGSNVSIPVAFGIDGGPPVLLVNHAAHLCWPGGSIVDLALNCRGSLLESLWMETYRGISRHATVPIPIRASPVMSTEGQIDPEIRVEARRKLSLPEEAIVLLTVGDTYKYTPMGDLNFFRAASALLDRHQEAHVLIVGVTESSQWNAEMRRYGQRFRLVGRQASVQQYYAAADVYLEGFPFGSTTALLEAGSHALPCVLAPEECPPPFGTDGIAIDGVIDRPKTLQDYIEFVSALIRNREERINCGRRVFESVNYHHTGPGWSEHLSRMQSKIPHAHIVHHLAPSERPPVQTERYWATFTASFEGDPLTMQVKSLLRAGVIPVIDKSLRDTYPQRTDETGLPLSVLIAITKLLPWCPATYRLLAYENFLAGVLQLRHSVRRLLAYIGNSPQKSMKAS